MNWCTIESDPGVFTELIEKFGVKDIQVEEVYDLSDTARLKPIYGYILLFKYVKDTRENKTVVPEVPGLFYAKQIISNACATQAIISILLNRPEIDIGDTLKNFKEMTTAFDPEMKGAALSNLNSVREAHNSFKSVDPFQIEIDKKEDSEDPFHFISYVPFQDVLFELDGLQEGPILHGGCTNANWLEKVRPIIEQRMQSYQTEKSSEIRFTLLALTKRLQTKYEEEVAELQKVESTPEVEARLGNLKSLIVDEEEKRKSWAKQNVRRRHNYVPFITGVLKAMGQIGLLSACMDDAVEKKKARVAAAKKKDESTESQDVKMAEQE